MSCVKLGSLTTDSKHSFEGSPGASFQPAYTDNIHLEPYTRDESEETRFEKGIIEKYEKITDSAGLVVRLPPYPLLSQLI